MCDKCLKRAIGREVLEVESKLNKVWEKIEADPTNLKNDPELIRLFECMASLLEKYNKL